MVYPSINELTRGRFNKYTLVIATAKAARLITDEYVRERTKAEKLIENKQNDKTLSSMINPEYRDNKAVKVAINKINEGDFTISGEESVVKEELGETVGE